MPPVICIQRNAKKIVPTEEDLIKTNRDGLGNQVGTITNRITAMMEIQSSFDPLSKEYKELEYRIATGQLYQQNCLDALKGIIAKPMPIYWYNYKACNGDKFLQSICVEKKPYFMTYIYDDYRRRLNTYIKESESTARVMFKTDLKILLNKIHPTKKEKKFIEYYYLKYPFGTANCAMNRICNYIELQFLGHVSKMKVNNSFDYTFLKTGIVYDENKYRQVEKLQEEFIQLNIKIKGYKYAVAATEKEEILGSKRRLERYVLHEIEKICPNEDERTDMLLDLHYVHHGNSQFFWICAGQYIIQRLERMVYGDI